MSDTQTKQTFDEIAAHKFFAPALFNRCWDLIDKVDTRTPEENDEMVMAAFASAYHWLKLEGHVDHERWINSRPTAQYQISRVLLHVGDLNGALYHANRSLEWCLKYNITNYNLSFSYERLAWVYHELGNFDERDKNLKLAKESGEKIADEGDRKYFLSELEKAPGFNAP